MELPIKILSKFPNLSPTRTSTFCDVLLQRVQFRALLCLCRSEFPFIRLAKGTNDFLYRRLLLERLEEGCSRLSVDTIFGRLAIAEPPATDESREGTAKDDPVRAQNPNVVFALNNPLRKCNTIGSRLGSIRMVIFQPIFADCIICEPTTILEMVREEGAETYDLYAFVSSTNLFWISSNV